MKNTTYYIESRIVSEAEFDKASEAVEWNTPSHEITGRTQTTTLHHETPGESEYTRITVTSTRSDDGRSFTDTLRLHR